MSAPYEIVTEQVNVARSKANEAYADATAFLERLALYTEDLVAAEITGIDLSSIPDPNITINQATAPVMPDVTLTTPVLPDPFVPTPITPINTGAIGALPEFTMSMPVLNIPTAPAALNVSTPGSPQNIVTDFDFPAAPTQAQLTIPNVPTLLELSLPVLQSIVLPEYDIDVPVYLGPERPDVSIHYTEAAYSSVLLEQVKAELLSRITEVGTGINPTIERLLWDRARDREEAVTRKAMDTTINTVVSRGWKVPQGALLAAIREIQIEMSGKILDLSREIAAKQMELQYDNLKSSLAQAIQLEGILIDQSDKIQSRALELQKMLQEAALDVYRSSLEGFKIQVEVFSAYNEAFKTRLQAELSKLEIFRGELEAQKTKNEVNDTSVKLYLSRLEAIKNTVDVYKTQVEAVNTRVGVEGLKLQNFKALVETYVAQVGAKRDEYGMYAEQVKAEIAKINTYESYAKAFASRVQAYAVSYETESKRVDVEIETEKMRLTEYTSRLDTALKTLTIQQQYVATLVEKYKAQIQGYLAGVEAGQAENENKIKVLDYDIKRATVGADIALKNAEIRLKNLEFLSGSMLESIKAGASISTQLAAASLSGLNISAGISGSGADNTYRNYNYEM